MLYIRFGAMRRVLEGLSYCFIYSDRRTLPHFRSNSSSSSRKDNSNNKNNNKEAEVNIWAQEGAGNTRLQKIAQWRAS
jgi:hypothetical protein